MTDPTLALAMELIARPSVTPQDGGCQALLGARLRALGFAVETLRFGAVDNLWATHGQGAPLVVLAGHTDVVPPGPPEAWTSPPFEPQVRDGRLYGRGAADMKSSLAAFVTAAQAYLERQPRHRGTVAMLITSDEEGPAVDGTARVVDWLGARGARIDYCIVGEPTCAQRLGDTVKHGRRGSLSARLTVHGIQGHVAYPQQALNPIHAFAPALLELATTEWDHGSADFPPTTFQVSNLHAGTGADNVIPGSLAARLNFRFSTAVTAEALQQRVERVLERHGLRVAVDWTLSGRPFLTRGTTLIDAMRRAIRDELGVEAALSTSGGTSDGRFIAPTGAEVAELGPCNQSIHQVNESIDVVDLGRLSRVYARVLEELLR